MRKGSHFSEETIANLKKAWETRMPVSLETRRKISIANTGKVRSAEVRKAISIVHKGKVVSDDTRRLSSLSHIGQQAWNVGTRGCYITTAETKRKISDVMKGKPKSDEHKRKLRVAKLKRLEELGIVPTEDKGAKEWFQKLNAKGFHYEPTVFMDIGYRADGYDKERHIWYEYDTPYHLGIRAKKKDIVRQNNIINHFKNIGNPLRHFIRAQVNDEGKVLCETYINKTI